MSTSAPPLQVEADDCRCHCGSLLARVVEAGVQLKCRRCKRTHVIAWEQVRTQRPEAPSPESQSRAVARPRRTRWLEALDDGS